MIMHRLNSLAYGTTRRAPAGFAHAILLDQGNDQRVWQVIDLYGPMELRTDAQVADWPVVYTPEDDEKWDLRA